MLNAIKHRGRAKLRTAQNSPRPLFLDRIFSEQPSDAQTFKRRAEADQAKTFTAGAKFGCSNRTNARGAGASPDAALNPAGEIPTNIPHRIAELFVVLHDRSGRVLRLFRE